MMLLGEVPPGKFISKRLGPYNKTWFIAYGIYSLNAVVFDDQLDLDGDAIQGLTLFCIFITYFYMSYILTFTIGYEFSANDQLLFRNLF